MEDNKSKCGDAHFSRRTHKEGTHNIFRRIHGVGTFNKQIGWAYLINPLGLEHYCPEWIQFDIKAPCVKQNMDYFVKLHSDLIILTQLQLVGVGVDFVFPLEEEQPSPSF